MPTCRDVRLVLQAGVSCVSLSRDLRHQRGQCLLPLLLQRYQEGGLGGLSHHSTKVPLEL